MNASPCKLDGKFGMQLGWLKWMKDLGHIVRLGLDCNANCKGYALWP